MKSIYSFRNFALFSCPLCEENDDATECQLWLHNEKPLTNSSIACKNIDPEGIFPDYVKGHTGKDIWWNRRYQLDSLGQEKLDELIALTTEATQGRGFQPSGKTQQVSGETLSFVETDLRDSAIRTMAAAAPLHNVSGVKKDLLRRGLTEEQIKSHPFVDPYHASAQIPATMGQDFPGFDEFSDVMFFINRFWQTVKSAFATGKKQFSNNSKYYFIPAYNFDGKVHGGQLGLNPQFRGRTNDKGETLGKYIHPGDQEFQNKKWSFRSPEFNEIPLTMLRGKGNVVILSEGILKPLVAHERLGRRVHIMGAAGGNFVNSRQNFEYNLTMLREFEGVDTVLFAVDKSWYSNNKKNVRVNVCRTLAICEEMGFTAQVLDYGQAEGKAEDIDVAPVSDILEHLKPYQKGTTDLLESIVLGSILPAPKSLSFNIKETIPVTSTDSYEQILDFYNRTDKKVLFDLRPMGAGKSHIVPDVSPAAPGGRVFYISQSPRMAPTVRIHEEFTPMPSRHAGLVQQEGRVNVLGEPLYLLPKASDSSKEHVGATCATPELFSKISSYGIHGSKICQSCPFFATCKDGGGEYNYLEQKKAAMGSSKVITAIDALNPDALTPDDTVIIDEVVSSVPFVMTTSFRFAHIRHWIDELNRQAPGLNLSFSEGKISYDWTLSSLMSVATVLDKKLAKKVEARISTGMHIGSTVPALCGEWIKSLSSGDAKVTWGSDSLTVQYRTTKVERIVAAAGKVVLLDATSSPTVLAHQYGINPEDVEVITCDDRATDSVEVTIMRTEGFNSRAGATSRQSLGAAVRNYFTENYGDRVGFATHREYAKTGDVIFFSDSRGSNRMTDKEHLVILGLPNPSLQATQLEYDLLADKMPGMTFNDYYSYKAHAELKQTIGRLRGFRRQQHLHAWVVANVAVDQLVKEGYKVNSRYADWLVGCETNANSQRTLGTIKAVIEAIKSNAGDTLAEICKRIAVRKDSVERTLKRIGLTFEALTSCCTQVIQPGKWSEYFPQDIVDAASQATEAGEDLDLSQFPVVSVVHAAKQLSEGFWPRGCNRQAVQSIQQAIAKLLGVRHEIEVWKPRVQNKILPSIAKLCNPSDSPQHIMSSNIFEHLRPFVPPDLLPKLELIDIIEFFSALEPEDPTESINHVSIGGNLSAIVG